MAQHPSEPRILVATTTVVINYEGVPYTFREDRDRIEEGHPIIRGYEHLFKPIEAHHKTPRVEAASAAPGERRGEQ